MLGTIDVSRLIHPHTSKKNNETLTENCGEVFHRRSVDGYLVNRKCD
jgi:hypothetical protein